MKKIDYIRLSHLEANQKIWDGIAGKFIALKQKNRLLAILWIAAASPVFGCIAVFSWISFFTMFFRDIRFTQHYMRTVITAQGMTGEQAVIYLDTCMQDYKNRLSYGNISVKEQKRIEVTFEVLYREFGITELSSNAVINESIQSLTQTVSEGNSELRTISGYAAWKHEKEIDETERKQQLQEQQEKRVASAYNRSKGRMLNTFEPAFTWKQLDTFVNCCNAIGIFTRDIETCEMQNILECSHKEPLQVNINKHLAALFDRLREHKLICKTWMSVAERHNCFVSKQGKPVTSKDLSAALSTASLIKQEVEDRINECVDAIINLD